ncbi:MAG: hypothetical protein KDC95_02345 [Planctomycetes bacterium]|nr:hypothetical protein [Planctomycetota bacterium]
MSTVLDSGELDVVHAQSDDDGRFRASVLENRDYSIWATIGDARTYRVTSVSDGVRGPKSIRLEMGDDPMRVTQVRFEGLAAWKARGPLLTHVVDPVPETVYRVPLEIAEDGTATLPHLPGERGWIEVDDAKGRPVFTAHVRPNDSNDAASPIRIAVAPPKKLRIRAKYAGGKNVAEPCVGAHVFFGRNPSRLPLVDMGVLDENGVFDLEVAFADPGDAQKLQAPGVFYGNTLADAAIVISGKDAADAFENLTVAGGTVIEDGVHYVDFELQEATVARGRLMLTKDRPASGARLLVYNSLYGAKGGGQCACAPRIVPCDAEGRFEIPGRGTKDGFRVTWIPTEAQRRALERDGSPIASEVVLAYRHARKLDEAIDLGTIRTDALIALHMQCRGIDGRPPIDGVLQVGERTQEGPNWPVRTRLDRRGRVTFLVPEGYVYSLLLTTPRSLIVESGTADVDRTIELRPDPERWFAGRLTAATPEAMRCLRPSGLTSTTNDPVIGRWSTNYMLSGATSADVLEIARIEEPGRQYRMRVWRYFGLPVPEMALDGDGKFVIHVTKEITPRFEAFARLGNEPTVSRQVPMSNVFLDVDLSK